MHGDGWMGWGYGNGMGWGGWFGMISFWVLLVVAIVLAVQWGRGRGFGGETPLDVLKKRYARGEITKEEFERMKRDLE